MIKIRGEIADIEAGRMPKDNNPLVNAPHPASVVLADQWDRYALIISDSAAASAAAPAV
jgi:glycine cleavage system protein P-like pyridoxal-binding family